MDPLRLGSWVGELQMGPVLGSHLVLAWTLLLCRAGAWEGLSRSHGTTGARSRDFDLRQRILGWWRQRATSASTPLALNPSRSLRPYFLRIHFPQSPSSESSVEGVVPRFLNTGNWWPGRGELGWGAAEFRRGVTVR